MISVHRASFFGEGTSVGRKRGGLMHVMLLKRRTDAAVKDGSKMEPNRRLYYGTRLPYRIISINQTYIYLVLLAGL